ncbi:MAG: hypothetical protein JRH19_21685, partial [Deltaproteobacteria bacterium]|nr:hypothetical protein [Deltaproteobacteria bacterium]
MRRRIPLSRARQLAPFIDFLDRIGAPIERGLERNKLPPGMHERSDMLVSTYATFGFVADMARREGIDEFGWRATSSELSQLSPGLVQRLRCSSALLQALETACALAYRESSNVAVWLEERRGSLFVCHRGSIEVGAPGSDDANVMRAVFLISIVRIFMGSEWTPAEIGLAAADDIGPALREQLPNARLLRSVDFWRELVRSALGQVAQSWV